MSERLKKIAEKELRTVARSIALKWGFWNNPSLITAAYTDGKFLTADDLKEVERLTDLYRAARAAYERGNYLACIEISTAEDKTA